VSDDDNRLLPPGEDDDSWLPPKETDLTKEEGDPGDRGILHILRERVKQGGKISFGKNRFIEWTSDAPAGAQESLGISAGIIAITAIAAALIGATVAAAASAPWWGVLVAAASFAIITVGVWNWIYLVIRHRIQD
jgi:hypothetical protein